MGVKGIVKFILRRIFEILVIGALLVLIPNLPPNVKFSQPFTVKPSKPFEGKLARNNRLDQAEIWHKGDFLGPEAFADLNGELFTSLYTGDIVKLTGEHITPIVKFGKPCKGYYEESKCGRPLGMEFDKDGYLIAADSYYGLFRVNVKTGEKVQLVSPKTEIDGKKPKIFNSLTIGSNGDIFWTDSSTDFGLDDGLFTLFADPSGRLIHYDPKTKKNKVLLDNIHFANGVALSENEDFIIVSETARSRIHRYYLKGPKKGTSDIFIDGLPGLPDNLKSDGKGGFLVPLVLTRDDQHPILVHSVGPFPLLRKAVARFMGVTQFIFSKFDQYYPNDFCLKAVHFIGHFTSLTPVLQSPRQTLLRLDGNGQIVDSLHTSEKKINGISEMHVFRDTLYLGSPFNDYIARIPLASIGWEDLKVERIRRSPNVLPTTTTPKPTTTTTTTTTPKPTTTTPKPTTTTPKATTTTPKPTTTTPKPTTTTPKATTTTPKPTTTTPKPTTTTPKPTTTTPKPTTTTSKPTATTPKPTTTSTPPPTTQKPVTKPKQEAPPQQQATTPPKQNQAPPQPKPVQQQPK